ncbi:CPBP family intramembrane glutamic endopeptidase [Gilvimarinus sp. DA14]|uniref:CPBP family intramembrane glutamic endopeptidase n=1 Tax=Gilvimarinus sp. DA14 TaxID=2956798 RepID=UPI0020B8F16A|nr:type II CAAX endopeptidase family protein [Gilvimarinus sp. DA14]UTF58697.1 CPBP family intramembrane metalloprotease [Gilvimarinus sp. DA14]
MRARSFWTFFSFEAALGLVGIAGLMLAGLALPVIWPVSLIDISWGIGAALLTYLGWCVTLILCKPLQNMLAPHLMQLRHLFKGAHLWQLVLISIAAGFGEELLFRAFLQHTIGHYWGDAVAICIAAFVFAALHFLSVVYFAVSLVMGLAFGLVYAISDSLLLVAVWHGLYDFIALVALLYRPRLLGLTT